MAGDGHASHRTLPAPATAAEVTVAGVNGSNAISPPAASTTTHCAVVGHASPRGAAELPSLTVVIDAPVRAGSNVNAAPVVTAVHCVADGHATLVRGLLGLTSATVAARGRAGSNVISSPRPLMAVHCARDGHATPCSGDEGEISDRLAWPGRAGSNVISSAPVNRRAPCGRHAHQRVHHRAARRDLTSREQRRAGGRIEPDLASRRVDRHASRGRHARNGVHRATRVRIEPQRCRPAKRRSRRRRADQHHQGPDHPDERPRGSRHLHRAERNAPESAMALRGRLCAGHASFTTAPSAPIGSAVAPRLDVINRPRRRAMKRHEHGSRRWLPQRRQWRFP